MGDYPGSTVTAFGMLDESLNFIKKESSKRKTVD